MLHQDNFYFSDGKHQIKCAFTAQCKEEFEKRYPMSTKIYDLNNRLVSISEYELDYT